MILWRSAAWRCRGKLRQYLSREAVAKQLLRTKDQLICNRFPTDSRRMFFRQILRHHHPRSAPIATSRMPLSWIWICFMSYFLHHPTDLPSICNWFPIDSRRVLFPPASPAWQSWHYVTNYTKFQRKGRNKCQNSVSLILQAFITFIALHAIKAIRAA